MNENNPLKSLGIRMLNHIFFLEYDIRKGGGEMFPQPYHMGEFSGQPGGQPSISMGRSPFKKLYKMCMKNRNQHVRITMIDGKSYTGFIEYVDQQHVYFAIPYTQQNQEAEVRHSDSQYRITGYHIQRCLFPLQAVMGVSAVY
jgi:hypothetical protein